MRTLHRSGYVHCNISPSTVKWFRQDNMWKLADFHHAARAGDVRRSGAPGLADVSQHYAAPESMHVRNPARLPGPCCISVLQQRRKLRSRSTEMCGPRQVLHLRRGESALVCRGASREATVPRV